VLAVAYAEFRGSRTLIGLYDPTSGKPYRLLVGHLQPVNQLAFSASRPLLASVAHDHTVCLWSLADLEPAVGQVPGLLVGQQGSKVVIREVELESAAAKAGLVEGDILEGVAAHGAKAKPVRDAAQFLMAVAALRPGDELDVTVRGKGVVKLPVDRGVDERQPLLSLLFLHSLGLPEWMAWSPAGPYDCSGPAAEEHLGWHTNTGDPAAPVSYAPARDYRNEYYREGILRYLAAEADLGRAVQRWNNDRSNRPSQEAVVPLRPDMALAPPVPRVRFISPPALDTARRPEYVVSFRVESARPLERVEIRRDSEVLYRADLKRVELQGGLYVLQQEALLRLKKGANTLELVAVNTEGPSPRAEVVVSYIEPAVLVTIDQVECFANDSKGQQVLKPAYGTNGDFVFPPAPRSLVLVAGRMRWSDPNAKALGDRGLALVTKVGGYRQYPVALEPRGHGGEANVRRFRVPLVLIGRKNRIKFELWSAGQERRLSRSVFELACNAPVEKQRLHLFIIGVNVTDAEGLKNRVLDALAVDSKDRPAGSQGTFLKKPPFEWCALYGVLAGEVDRAMVEARLVEIDNEIKRLGRVTGWANDVVLIYYQGEDAVVPGKKERWLKMSNNFRYPKVPVQQFALPCHDLSWGSGTRLLLLNVPWAPGDLEAGPDWGGDPDTGFLRYACHDPAEVRTASPALLSLLQQAIRKHGRLGEVAKYLNDLFREQPSQFSPLVILDEDQANLRISEPDH
jgi:hypothetical protein